MTKTHGAEVLSFPRTLINMWLEHRRQARDASEKAALAKAFNNRYTYRERWQTHHTERLPGSGMFGFTPEKGNAWMCPECNQVHLAYECSAFDGLHYPGCCNTPDGNRLHCDIRLPDR